MTHSTNRVGRDSEEVAARYLESLGYRIRARNWRTAMDAIRGELDIVADDRRTLVVCEVKSRRWASCDDAFAAVTYQKQRQIRRLAALYLASCDGVAEVRFDVVAVAWPATDGEPQIRHIKGAF